MVKHFLIFNDYAYSFGGAGTVAFSMALGLKSRGYDVVFISGTGPEDSTLPQNGIHSICLSQPDILSDNNRAKAVFRGIWNLKAFKVTKSLLKKYSSSDTVVVIHGFSKTLSCSVFSALKGTGFKVILVLHDYFPVCPNGGFYNYKKKENCKFKPLSWNCLFCNCDSRNYLQKIYRYIRQLFIRHSLYGNKSNLYALNVSDYSGSLMYPYISNLFSEYLTIQNPINLNDGDFIDFTENSKYIFIGRLSEEKGIRDFCRVITELNLDGVVVGDGYLLGEMRDMYPNISFVGYLNKEKKEKFIKESKCLVFPSSIHETFGMAIAEMLSYGIPCIVPNDCGASYLVKDGINGFVFPMGNYNELKNCIIKFEKADLHKMMNDTRMSFEKGSFSIDTYLNRVEALINRILE